MTDGGVGYDAIALTIIERRLYYYHETIPFGKRVDVLFWIFQEIEGGVGGCCLKPLCLIKVGFFGQ